MVKDVGLDIFVVNPVFDAGKEVEFDWYPFFVWLELAHHAGHIVVYFGVIVEVLLKVGAKDSYVGLAAAVHKD